MTHGSQGRSPRFFAISSMYCRFSPYVKVSPSFLWSLLLRQFSKRGDRRMAFRQPCPWPSPPPVTTCPTGGPNQHRLVGIAPAVSSAVACSSGRPRTRRHHRSGCGAGTSSPSVAPRLRCEASMIFMVQPPLDPQRCPRRCSPTRRRGDQVVYGNQMPGSALRRRRAGSRGAQHGRSEGYHKRRPSPQLPSFARLTAHGRRASGRPHISVARRGGAWKKTWARHL